MKNSPVGHKTPNRQTDYIDLSLQTQFNLPQYNIFNQLHAQCVMYLKSNLGLFLLKINESDVLDKKVDHSGSVIVHEFVSSFCRDAQRQITKVNLYYSFYSLSV